MRSMRAARATSWAMTSAALDSTTSGSWAMARIFKAMPGGDGRSRQRDSLSWKSGRIWLGVAGALDERVGPGRTGPVYVLLSAAVGAAVARTAGKEKAAAGRSFLVVTGWGGAQARPACFMTSAA